jgi:hypothetical protein
VGAINCSMLSVERFGLAKDREKVQFASSSSGRIAIGVGTLFASPPEPERPE